MAISSCQDSLLLVFPLGNADNQNLTHGAISFMQPQISREAWHVKQLNIGHMYIHSTCSLFKRFLCTS
jgi:hypothetical protein